MLIWWALPEESGMEGEPGGIDMEGGSVLVAAGDGGRVRLLDIEINGRRLKNGEIERYFSNKEGEFLL